MSGAGGMSGAGVQETGDRAIVLWLPDWPVTAYLRSRGRPPEVADDAPLAVMHANRVVAASASARHEGVRRGQRRRDAQGACPSLRLVPHDPKRDEREFLPVLARIEQLAPGAQLLRPGLCAVRARGPARFYGGEASAARTLLGALDALELTGARAGVADGLFTAEQAARLSRPSDDPVRVVPKGASGAFLAPLTIAAIGDEALVDLLARLGVQTLGDFAALDVSHVRDRLGERGVRLHALAGGADSRPVVPRVPPPELAREIEFEDPLALADQIAFAVRTTADAVCEALDEAGLVCTAVRITLADEFGGRSERVWLHPSCFDAPAVVDRVRWQLQSAAETSGPADAAHTPEPGPAAEGTLRGGVVRVRVEPEAVDDSAHHQPALLGQGPDERLHHAMSRVQAMLGHRGVVTPALGGGRWLEEREQRVPWGDGERPPLPRDLPWPGSLPQPLPAEVFRPPRPVRVTARDGADVAVDDRGRISAEPAAIDGRPVTAWAGPWPVQERGWDPSRARSAHRLQLVDAGETAWLVVLERGIWRAEGRYV